MSNIIVKNQKNQAKMILLLSGKISIIINILLNINIL